MLSHFIELQNQLINHSTLEQINDLQKAQPETRNYKPLNF
jgi:hypothetical protein